jgi:2-dehydropantoate 2-reductase
MRFIIVGAGGIGAYYGARLLAAGHNVVLVARGEHLQKLQTDGLQVLHPSFSFHGPVMACDQEELAQSYRLESADLVILTLKASQTDAWLESMAGWLRQADCPVLSLQNGVDNELRIEQTVGRERTAGGLAVRIGGHVTQPGTVEATGPGEVILGAWPDEEQNQALQERLAPYVKLFNDAVIPTTLTSRIQHELWLKLLINNGVNPLSALTRLDTRALTSDKVYGAIVHRLMREAAAAARADGVDISPEEVDNKFRLICQFDAIKTSMLIDREKGRPLELDAICGAVLRRSEALGIEAPFTALIDAFLRRAVL